MWRLYFLSNQSHRLSNQSHRSGVFFIIRIQVHKTDQIDINAFGAHLSIFVTAVPIVIRVAGREDEHARTVEYLHLVVVGINALSLRCECFIDAISVR